MKTIKEILKKVKKTYTNKSWRRSTKEATKLVRFINGISLHYSHVLNLTQEEVLNALENNRSNGYAFPNYYQSSNFPRIKKNQVEVFENKKQYLEKFPSQIFICPACNGESTDPNECNSGLKVLNAKGFRRQCDWKSYGLLGTMGMGYSFIIKDEFLKKPVVYHIFKPKELI